VEQRQVSSITAPIANQLDKQMCLNNNNNNNNNNNVFQGQISVGLIKKNELYLNKIFHIVLK
jgi:predicted solute-binding protein